VLFARPLAIKFMLMINSIEAHNLVKTGDWIYGSDAIKFIESISLLIPNESEVSKDVKVIGKIGRDWKIIAEIQNDMHSLLQERFEMKIIHPEDRTPFLMGIRIQEYCVYKVGDALRNGTVKFLGLVAAGYALTLVTGPIGWIAPTLATYEFFKTIITAFEKIEDPDEKQIFETIYKLERTPVIVDHDAYKRKDHTKAYGYGHKWPTFDEIKNELGDQLSDKEIKKSLVSLKKRGILGKNNGRWKINI
jgi:hypothetical protein